MADRLEVSIHIPNKLADLRIAGIAAAYGLELATPIVGDFVRLRLTSVDPWRLVG